MNRPLDRNYFRNQLEYCRKMAAAADHPDVKEALLSYVTHYQTLLDSLSRRYPAPAVQS